MKDMQGSKQQSSKKVNKKESNKVRQESYQEGK